MKGQMIAKIPVQDIWQINGDFIEPVDFVREVRVTDLTVTGDLTVEGSTVEVDIYAADQVVIEDITDNSNPALRVLQTNAATEIAKFQDGTIGVPVDRLTINQGAAVPATPTLAFGDGDTGIYESVANEIGIALAGTLRYNLSASRFKGLTNDLFGIVVDNAPSATVPVFLPANNDADTGIGHAAEDQLSLISGGVEGLRISEGNGEVSSVFGANVVGIITEVTSNGTAVVAKAGIETGVSIGDAIIVFAGTTVGDYGTYIVKSVSVADQITLDRALSGSDADISIAILADGVVIENSTNPGVTRIILNPGTVIFPALAFGDGDTGLYEFAANEIGLSIAGTLRLRISSSRLRGGTTSLFAIATTAAASATVPVFLPANNDADTGIGRAGADQLSLISGGVEGLRIIEDTTITHLRQGLTGRFTSESVADEAEILIATGTAGFGFVQAGDDEEWAQFTWKVDGTVNLVQNSTNVVNTDTDTNLCIYDAGTGIAIKNRLGATKVIRFNINYS